MTAIENTFTLDVPSTTQNLAMIREFVNRVAAQAGLSEIEVGQLELAVDEACANVIEHAYGDDKTKQVMVRAIFDEYTLRIHVIETLMDEVHYDIEPGKRNELRMVKKLRK